MRKLDDTGKLHARKRARAVWGRGVEEVPLQDGNSSASYPTQKHCSRLCGIQLINGRLGRGACTLTPVLMREEAQIWCVEASVGTRFVFHITIIQKRLSDFAFAKASTWPEVQQVHQTWWKNYNQEDHLAHHKRQDGRHSPNAVLRGVLGRTYPQEVLQSVLYATQFTRYLDQRGYARFKKWRFFGEDGLAGEEVSIWMYEGMIKIEHQTTTLAEYAVRTTPDHKQIEEVRRSRRIETHFRSPQLRLWQTEDHDWVLALRQPERQKHKTKRGPADIVQLRFPEMENLRNLPAL